MDFRLAELAERFSVNYTRYADDITFSGTFENIYTGDRFFALDGPFFQRLLQIVDDNGFSFNEKKIRLAHQGERKEVTGLIVTEKVNLSHAFTKNLRAAIFQMEHYIPDEVQMRQISGRLAYMKMIKGATDSTYQSLRKRFRRIQYKIKAHKNKNAK